MSWRDAPLYVEAYDLSRWTIERSRRWRERGDRTLAPRIEAVACDLVSSIALALTFPDVRSTHLQLADEAVVRMRTLLRLARDTGVQSAGGVRFAAGRLRVIGRMIGGWRKRVRKHHEAKPRVQGRGPPAARPA